MTGWRPDIWNNPLVISAWRVRHRKSPLGRELVLNVMVWGIVAAAIFQFAPPRVDRAKIFFVAMVSVTGAIATFATMASTQASMHNEVLNRTLDFQRIATLSPQRLLAGKLFGEGGPAMLHVLATLPLAVGCVTLGVAPLSIVLLLYVSLLTSTILGGTIGLNHPFELRSKKGTNAGSPQRGGAVGGLIAAVMMSAQVLFHSGAMNSPWLSPVIGLLTPVLAIRDVAAGEPWAARFSFFGLEVPYVWLTPLAQLLAARWLFGNIARRLVYVGSTSLSKQSAYVALGVVDLISASVLFAPAGGALPLPQRVAAFAVAHLVASLVLTFGITPGRDLLTSWIWRFRDVEPRGRDALWGARSPNTAALIVFVAEGALGLALLVIVPALVAGEAIPAAELAQAVAEIGATVAVVTLALGQLLQGCYLRIEKNIGGLTFLILVVLLDVPAHVVGEYLHMPLISGLAPSAHFIRWLSGGDSLPVAPLLGLYVGVGVVARLGITRWMRRKSAEVDRKLAEMGVQRAISA